MSKLGGWILNRRYRVEAFLGRGGMAEVFLAHDGLRTVARASLKPDTATDMVGFRCKLEDQYLF